MKVLNSRKIRITHADITIDREHALIVSQGRFMIITTEIKNNGPIEVTDYKEYNSSDDAYKTFIEMTKCTTKIVHLIGE